MNLKQHIMKLFLILAFWGMIASDLVFGKIAPVHQPVDYKKIDRHALNTPKSAEQSFESLALYLSQPARNDFEKTRAIYRWITENINYDTKGFFSGRYGDLSAKGVLKSRTAVCEGYAGLFERLASAAGLEVVKISGFAKGYGYVAGSPIIGPSNHAWNAIKINGLWHLLDCTWGAGYVDSQGRFVRRFEEHYFFTPPEEFIYNHFPENSRWQLLEQPISKAEYEKLIYLRPAFFKYGLKPESHFQAKIQTDHQVSITFSAPDNVLLTANLEQNYRKLDGYLTFSQKHDHRYNIQAFFPRAGSYVLRVFATDKKKSANYQGVLEYKVEAKKGMGKKIGFPETYGTFHKKKVYLYGPMNGNLKSGDVQKFKLMVPGAENVIIINRGRVIELKKQGELFAGEVKVKKGKVTVCAEFPGEKSYASLLRYIGF
ncbi:hypothetical protein H8E88_01530 [candidate division KSB1 bacterium]|nr:hypothetical protein [candidate division KSB1 bacterium]MBL7094749.1 hypothetical protein [candidate division KSB1 bacterium]